jgi:hypothetical protein
MSIRAICKGFRRRYLLWTASFLTSIAPRLFQSSILRTRLIQSILEDKAASSVGNLSASTQRTIVALPKMARGKSFKPKGERRTSFMFPSLHQNVVNAVPDRIVSTWFHEKDSDRDSNNKYETHIIGRFKCSNNACSERGWGSKMVAILIRGYPRNGYNAVVFNQRCKSCNQLGTLTINEESYVDRVAYRVKKWAGVPMKQPSYAPSKGPPHESSLCEGCKRGVCRQTNDWE